MELKEYADRYKSAVVERADNGVLTVRLHTDGGPLVWDGVPHSELHELFAAIASDRNNRAVVLTGTGDEFIVWRDEVGEPLARGEVPPRGWDRVVFEGRRAIMSLLDIDVPVIAAVNGPVGAHSELAVLSDVVLASETASFRDGPHFCAGVVPGDGMQVIWPLLLGPNRGRYFLLTGETITAETARELGVVAEVLPSDRVLPRAYELASQLAGLNPTLLRYTRRVLTFPLKKAMLEQLDLGLGLEALASVSNADWMTRKPISLA